MPEQRKIRSLTCQEVAKLATEFLEDRLPVSSLNDIRRHLEACSPCSTYVEQLTLVRDSLGKLPDTVMPDDVRAYLFQRLARIARERGGPR